VNGCWSVVGGDGVVFLLGFFLADGSSFDDAGTGTVAAVGQGPVLHFGEDFSGAVGQV
jgi:hypothetical protein